MLEVSNELVNAFLGSAKKDLRLEFTDNGEVIDNNSIYAESMDFEQTLCDENALVYGKCSSASFKVRVRAGANSYKGREFKATLSVGDYSLPIGTFTVIAEPLTDDRNYRDLECYDALYDIANKNVASWYNNLQFPMTMKEFRTSFIEHIGLELEEKDLVNDGMIITKTIETDEMSGLDLIENICEINACFGNINSFGQFSFVTIEDLGQGLYPDNELYPNDELYPKDEVSETLTMDDYYPTGFRYEEYVAMPVTQVLIKQDADDLGVEIGEEGNTYIIDDNFLIGGKTSEEIHQIGENFLRIALFVKYNPSSVRCVGRLWLQMGDYIKVIGQRDVIKLPILHRRLSGISHLVDEFDAKGVEYYLNSTNSLSSQIKQVRNATSRIVSDVGSLKLEVADKVGTDEVVSAINLSQEKIELIGNRLVIDSDNFKISEEGKVVISGDFESNPQKDTQVPEQELPSEYFAIKDGNMYFGKGSSFNMIYYDDEGMKTKSAFSFGTFLQMSSVKTGLIQSANKMEYKSDFMKFKATSGAPYQDHAIEFDGDVGFLKTAYTSSGAVVTSDRDLKHDIKYLEKEKLADFIYSLKPCEFRYNDGESERLHHGLIAQDVKESMGNEDWGVYIDSKPQEKGHKGIRYEELISDLIATVQSQNERISELEKKLKGE